MTSLALDTNVTSVLPALLRYDFTRRLTLGLGRAVNLEMQWYHVSSLHKYRVFCGIPIGLVELQRAGGAVSLPIL